MEKQTIEPIVMLYDRIAVHLCPLRNGKTVILRDCLIIGGLQYNFN